MGPFIKYVVCMLLRGLWGGVWSGLQLCCGFLKLVISLATLSGSAFCQFIILSSKWLPGKYGKVYKHCHKAEYVIDNRNAKNFNYIFHQIPHSF